MIIDKQTMINRSSSHRNLSICFSICRNYPTLHYWNICRSNKTTSQRCKVLTDWKNLELDQSFFVRIPLHWNPITGKSKSIKKYQLFTVCGLVDRVTRPEHTFRGYLLYIWATGPCRYSSESSSQHHSKLYIIAKFFANYVY